MRPRWCPSWNIHSKLHNTNLLNVTHSIISLTLRNKCFQFKSHSLLFSPLPYIISFDMKVNHQRFQTTRSRASHCHHCDYCHWCTVDFVLFHNVTWCTNSLLSRNHVNTMELLNITCTLAATNMILQSLECTLLWATTIELWKFDKSRLVYNGQFTYVTGGPWERLNYNFLWSWHSKAMNARNPKSFFKCLRHET